MFHPLSRHPTRAKTPITQQHQGIHTSLACSEKRDLYLYLWSLQCTTGGRTLPAYRCAQNGQPSTHRKSLVHHPFLPPKMGARLRPFKTHCKNGVKKSKRERRRNPSKKRRKEK
ncbi:hypothetical protein L484_017605 [Morus notabilis]|uniref:Uncharacterized protein n=1 Tax=Morus notabilis TaxID=981085 RepID=W9QZW0_9ROSA|nr:hypothetical protein L484_017605 [Morus notabilis]